MNFISNLLFLIILLSENYLVNESKDYPNSDIYFREQSLYSSPMENKSELNKWIRSYSNECTKK